MNYRQAKKGCMKHGSYHISKKENKETSEKEEKASEKKIKRRGRYLNAYIHKKKEVKRQF